MNEIITSYGQLVSFLASIIGVTGALVGLFMYSHNKHSKLTEDKHRFIVKKRSFEINNLKGLIELKLHPENNVVSIDTLESIYNDTDKSAALIEKYSGSYNSMYKLISLNREINNGSLQKNLALSFCIFTIIITLLSVFTYMPNKALNSDAAESAAPVS